MDNPGISGTMIGTLDQTDEDILTYTVSDEALEAAAGPQGKLGSMRAGDCCFSFLRAVRP
jgi:hypothetical protein